MSVVVPTYGLCARVKDTFLPAICKSVGAYSGLLA